MSVRAGLPPTLPDIGETGGGSGWVKLTRARDDIDAHLLMGRLDAAGIESSGVRDISGPGAWMFGGANAGAPVTIMVKRLQYEDARLVLAEISLEGPSVEPPVAAPSGRSRLVPVVWWALAIGIGLLFTALSLVRMATARPEGAPCKIPVFCSGD